MHMRNAVCILVLIAGFGTATRSPAQTFDVLEVIPASPLALQPVRVRTEVSACIFSIGSPRIEADLIRVDVYELGKCSPLPPPTQLEISLGSLPAGRYRVAIGQPGDPVAFEVTAAPASTRRRPLDETGLWWDPRFPGSAVMVLDVFGGRRVVMFATYETSRLPVYYTMLIESEDHGEGMLFASRGTPAGSEPAEGDFESFEAGLATLNSVDGNLEFEYQLFDRPVQQLLLQRFPL